MSSLLSYHIFSFFISNIFKNFKFGRNFSKFTAGMGCRLIAVSVKIAGNRRLPIGKENTAWSTVLNPPLIPIVYYLSQQPACMPQRTVQVRAKCDGAFLGLGE